MLDFREELQNPTHGPESLKQDRTVAAVGESDHSRTFN